MYTPLPLHPLAILLARIRVGIGHELRDIAGTVHSEILDVYVSARYVEIGMILTEFRVCRIVFVSILVHVRDTTHGETVGDVRFPEALDLLTVQSDERVLFQILHQLRTAGELRLIAYRIIIERQIIVELPQIRTIRLQTG